MLQARFVTDRQRAEAVARRLEAAFDEEGWPVACYDTAYEGPFAVDVLFLGLSENEIEARLRAVLGDDYDALGVSVAPLADENWVEKSLEGLSPVVAGRFFVHGSHDRHRRRISGVNIEIDANLAFGTGHHGSTRGCLIALDRVLKRRRPRRVLDIGTGTGVLAFAAAKTLHVPVLASDIDPLAVRMARANAAANAVLPLVETVTAAGLAHPAFRRRAPFDLVMANILARPLAALAPVLARHLAGEAALILSGLRLEDGARVLAAYRPHGLYLVDRLVVAEWLTLILERRR